MQENAIVYRRSSFGKLFRMMTVKSFGCQRLPMNYLARSTANYDKDSRFYQIEYGCVPKTFSTESYQIFPPLIETQHSSRKAGPLVLRETEIECTPTAMWLVTTQDLCGWNNVHRRDR